MKRANGPTIVALAVVIAAGSVDALHRAAAAQAPEQPAASATQQPSAPPVAVDPAAPLELKTARDLLSLYGADNARFDEFTDGQPLQADEVESLLRVLIAVRRFTFGELYRWRRNELPWQLWADNPYEQRGEVIDVKMRVRRVERLETTPEQAERCDLTHYYRCDCVLPNDQPATVFALTIPKDWKVGEALDEPSGVTGIFLKVADAAPRPLHPMFVAQRVAWFPDTELGRLGMDVSLFDDVQNRTSFEAKDGACFYELLAAVGRAPTSEFMDLTRDETVKQSRYAVEPLFNRPDQQFGNLMGFTGRAKRCVRVIVENPDVVRTLGYDHYYQLEMFTNDSQRNPITCCVRELPQGMPIGEQIEVDVRVPGFFFKVWKFPTGLVDGKTRWQFAPVIVARSPVIMLLPPESWVHQALVTGAFAFGVVLVAGSVIWLVRGDRRERRKMEQLTAARPVSFDQLDWPAPQSPPRDSAATPDAATMPDSAAAHDAPATHESQS